MTQYCLQKAFYFRTMYSIISKHMSSGASPAFLASQINMLFDLYC